uniref:RING-type E3 ubiquitin transferase n=1 Tax=Opuntia streptacantha TaxID=393608 RepID=A0A7C9DZV7_OPUST
MAHRHLYSSSPIFEAEPDQHWNHMPADDPYIHFARTGATENGTVFHAGESGSVDRAHYASQWNATGRLNGYSSSSQMVNAPHFQPDASDPPRDSLHPAAAAANVFMVSENHVHHASSSNYGVDSNFFDLSMSNGRRPYKRKSPGIPAVGERGTASRYYCAGSSSDMPSSSELWQDKSTLDGHHSRWESLNVPPSYRANQLSIGGDSSLRNVRSRPALDLDSDVFRTHLPPNYSHHPSSSRLPVDQAGAIDHPSSNPGVPIQEWNPIHVSGAPHARPIVSNSLTHESSHFFPGSIITNASGEMAGFHHEHISSRNAAVPQNLHPTPSHTRGVRSSYTHRSGNSSRISLGSLRIGHVPPLDEGLQLVGESHSSRHPRPFVGWRNGDRSGRSRLSSERHRLLAEDTGSHDRLTPEGLMIVDQSSLYGSRSLFDQHRDMRLDVDNMSYEELLALGERIGCVNTGICEDQLPKCLTESVYCSSDQVQEEGRCVICLEEYQHMDDVGTLKACGHDYHVACVKKWLSMKNTCPICKGPALPDNVKDKK